jgi:hypothetical protein
MNQQTLADKLGLTFQQVQKYEAGANRVSASALATIADTLGVPVSFFFANSPIDHDARMELPETIELLRCYYSFAMTGCGALLGACQSRGGGKSRGAGGDEGATMTAERPNADDLRAKVFRDRIVRRSLAGREDGRGRL